MDEFPPNSQKAKHAAQPKRVERVTSAEVVRRRRPLGKQFTQTFFGGDAKTAVQYMITNVLVPAAKEALVEAASSGFEKLVYGEARPRRGAPPSAYGHINYSRMSTQRPTQDDRPPLPQGPSRSSRARQNFSELVIQHRQEAEVVLERMFDILSQYDQVSVADLYELTGIAPSHVDQKWGWTDLHGSQIGRVRSGGYSLELPNPVPLGR